MSGIDTDAVKTAYEDVRDDRSETSWVFLKYKDNKIVCDSVGTGFEEFKSKFTDDERGFGFIRLVTGDEMSKRSKFALITWIGQDVSTLKKAKVSTDKGLVKQIIQVFAKELMITDINDLEEDHIRTEVQKAGGAIYGTGKR